MENFDADLVSKRHFWAMVFILALSVRLGSAADPQLGDLDGDGRITILDVVQVIQLSRSGAVGASARTIAIADVNQDGTINDTDAAMVAAAAAGLVVLPKLPLDTIRATSPAAGEDGVLVTRQSVFYLTMPLADTTVITTTNLHANFGARQILSRVELASDHRTVTLFYLEPMPGSAHIVVTFDGTGLTDFLGRAVDLDGDGIGGGVATLGFDTLTLSPVANTTASGRVFASEVRSGTGGATNVTMDTPLSGVTITVDGMEESMRAVTDNLGNFQLNPAPAGAFFVHIDGRTVTNLAAGIRYPDLAYYPFVGKRWVSIAGQDVNIGDIFLPLIVTNTLQTTVAGTPTVVTFPTSVVAGNSNLAGVSLQVPADSLFKDDGTRGGKIGIAPVAPDRLPGPLPPGVNPALVITVQTDGAANFDKPVPACFPNLPDPTTGQKLAPGAKSALWSFNHQTGRFEIVGAMTVSDDGTLVCTDPGVGILAPGWHFQQQGTSTRGGGTGCDGSGSRSPYEPGTQGRPPGQPGKGPCEPKRTTAKGGRGGDPIQLFSGEMIEEVIDLQIAGRGFDFVWQRTYRSRSGPNTTQGNGWDHPYDIYVEATGPDLILHDGNGRGDKYSKQPDGTWTRAEFFRVLTRETDGSFTLTFEDQGKWGFFAFDSTARAGRVSYNQDRNGNRMSFTYDPQGRIAVVNDTLGRNINIAYNSDGFIQSVTDFAGRAVRYDYYHTGDTGGGAGDLKSVTTPSVNNTPNGNDFPNGKTTTYTYSTGFADERLNHNLLSITDGRRNDPTDPTFGTGPYLVNIYSPSTDPNDPDFDRVIRQVWGGSTIDFVFVPLLPASPNGFAVMRTIMRDRVGNVSEHFFDANNRLVRLRQFTGRAAIDVPTTALDNRPANPLRSTDPDYFETIYEWTDDSLQRRVTNPNGNITEYVYESDLNPGAPARTRGNVRTIRHLPGTHVPAGDQPVIEETFEYDTDFASCCGFNFVTRITDGRGSITSHEYDTHGNRIRTRSAVSGVIDEWEYNLFGQVTAHIAPPDSAGLRRRDEQEYYASGPQTGYMSREIVDATGIRITTTFEYNSVGLPTRITDPRGSDTQRVYNELNQVVRVISPEVTTGSGIRYRKDFYYDANDNVARMDIRNIDENGVLQANTDFTTLFEYEMLNFPVRMSQEIDETHSAVTEFAYDANRNRVLIRQPEAVSGRQPANVFQTRYDERDMIFQVIAAPGDPAQSTSQTDYDLNGNRVRSLTGIESGAHLTTFEYDGYDRLVSSTDAMGNRRRLALDAAHNAIHGWTEGELVDLPGSTNNVRLAEILRTFDAMNRLIQVDVAHFDPATQQPVGDGAVTTRIEYSGNSEPVHLVNDNGHDLRFSYDTAHRLITTTDARGDVETRAYDANGNVIQKVSTEKSDLGVPDVTFATRAAFDNLNRVIQLTDNAGNINQFGYDSRNNEVLTIDAARPSPTAPGNRTHRIYDGLGRLTQVIREMTSDGTGGGNAAGQIVLRREWDNNGRPTAMFDANGNPTRFVYDPLDRLIQSVLPSGATKAMQYNAHSEAVSVTDANGTVITQQFDALDRTVRKNITPAPGVAADTTFEDWSYDGMSRTVRTANDSSQVLLGYDSVGNLTRDSIDGHASQRAYDGMGNPISTTYPGQRKIAATFDPLEQLKTLVDSTTTNPVAIASYDYAGPGRVARRSNGNNTRLDLAYDSVKRLTRSTHSTVAAAAFEDRDYAWDANYNQVLNHDRRAGGLAQAYAYDSAYRLRSVQFSGALTEHRDYQLDSAGNRLTVTGDGDAGAYTQGGSPLTDSVLNQYTSTPFDQRAYDANGNLTHITAAQPANLQFDYRNRLVRFDEGAASTRYVYDPFGRRVARVTGATTTRYFYFGSQVLEEQDGSGATQATYVMGLGMNDVIAMQRNGKNFWLHADDKLSVRRVTDASGQVVEAYDYDEFGNPALFNGAGQPITSSAVGNPYMYTGHHFDPETGFYFTYHRYYDARAGRFITRDPAGAFGDPMNMGNAFTYAGNNPGTYVDPMGLSGAIVQPGDYGHQAVNAPANLALTQAWRLAKASEAASAESFRMTSDVSEKMFNFAEHIYQNGLVSEAVAENGTELGDAADLIYESDVSLERATQVANTHYSMGNAGYWRKMMERRAAALEEKAAGLAQKGSKLKTAGKVLGAAAVAIQTGVAMKEAYDNCAGGWFILNEGLATAGANALVMAIPPLGMVDMVTGGSVSGVAHNGLMVPTAAGHLIGRMTNRDADNIKASMTSSPATRLLWSAGEGISNLIFGD